VLYPPQSSAPADVAATHGIVETQIFTGSGVLNICLNHAFCVDPIMVLELLSELADGERCDLKSVTMNRTRPTTKV
jgi:hypothetical protein